MKHFIIYFAILLLATGLQGRMIESSMQFRNISVEDGLPHNSVTAFYKDDAGFLWIGTKEGLVRSDGNKLINFHSKVSDDIWSIDSLNGDTLILATISGLRWFDKASHAAGNIENAPKIWFSSLCKIGGGSVLAGSEQGLYLVKSGKVVRIPIDNMLAYSNHITGIISAPDGKGYWFSSADGLGYLDSQLKPTIYRMHSEGSRSNYFTCLKYVKDDIYLGSYNRGVYKFNTKTQEFTPIDTDNANLIMHLDADENNLYIGTNGRGLIIMDLTTGSSSYAVHKRSSRYSIASNAVTALLSDDKGVYIGTQFGGVSYYSRMGRVFEFYRTPSFNSTEYNARSIYFYPDGEMLLGTRSDIFQIKDNRLIHSIETSDFDGQLRSGIITYIGDYKGRVLTCSYGGGVKVYDRNTGRLTPFNQNEEYAQYGRIFHFVSDKQGHLWFASHEGVYETDANGNLLRYISSTNSSMRNDATFWLAFDKEDRLWIASIFGLVLLDPATGKMYDSLPNLPKEMDVRYIYRDSHDDMWVCGNKGVYCLNRKLEVVRVLDTSNILPENTVMSVIEYPKNIIRISTLHNIIGYNLANETYRVYRRNDGIGTEDFNGNVVVSPDKKSIYWTNEGGLLHTPSVLVEVAAQQLPEVTSIQIDDRVLSYNTESVDLAEGESVQFSFSHLDFRFPEHECFEYMLEGKDDKWKLISGESSISYHALDPGDYCFKIRNPGSEEFSTTKVTVRHSTWKLVLFWVGVLMLVFLIVITVYWINRLYRRIAERTQAFSILKKKALLPETESKVEEAEEQAVNPLMEKLLTLIEDQKIYLDPKLKISTVAEMLGCKENELSRFLNSELSTNFTSFINTYRVKAIKSAMEAGELKRYTITAIGLKNGYNSKMTFYRAFKAIEGKTPLEFCKDMGYTMKNDE